MGPLTIPNPELMFDIFLVIIHCLFSVFIFSAHEEIQLSISKVAIQ